MKKYFQSLFYISIAIIFLAVPNHSRAGMDGDLTNDITGFAWSSNIGWISFSSTDKASFPSYSGPQYGVDASSTGYLTGYAWSDNVGWIQFGGLSGFPTNGVGTTEDNAKLDSTNKLTGWVKVLSAANNGWDGWISLSGSVNVNGSNYNYGPTYDSTTGTFSGWAWGSDVVGWISFNNLTSGDSVTYSVKGPSNFPPPSPVPASYSVSSTCNNNAPFISISFTPSTGATSYNGYRCTSNNFSNSDGTCTVVSNQISSPLTDTLANSTTTYYYFLTAVNNNGESGPSSVVTASVKGCTVNSPTPTTFQTKNPSIVNVKGGKCSFSVSFPNSFFDSYAVCQITDALTGAKILTFSPKPGTNSVSPADPNYQITGQTKYKLICGESTSTDPTDTSSWTNVSNPPASATCHIGPDFKEVP